jgi:hypothetical protein
MGDAVAVGSVDQDGLPELFVGVPFDSVHFGRRPPTPRVGRVCVLGLSHWGMRIRGHIPDRHLDGTIGTGDRVGASLAAGDLDGDGYDELVVGVPGKELGGRPGSNAFLVVPAASDGSGLESERTWIVSLADLSSSPTAPGQADFGPDLLVLAGRDGGHGRVVVGLAQPASDGTLDGSLLLIDPEIDGSASADLVSLTAPDGGWSDQFGQALSQGDFDADGRVDLVVGDPGTGTVAILPGGADGPDTSRYRSVSPTDLGLASVEGSDFGAALP